ncbi:hypothetical protein D4L85_10140 [Chryseolinea soli]|uniref:Uncharacterized protein n=2 Tax=Chryseolinea soli TaxID=2321403 RepID=A0A385SKB6_9BACT|nr:hypothetical protein D4L85_10140 [Chryseolinea soli]
MFESYLIDDMDTQELLKSLEALKNVDEKSYFAVKQYGGGPEESYALTNRNGIISVAKALLKLLDEHDKTGRTEMPFGIFDERGDTVIEYITFKEPPKVEIEKPSRLVWVGCTAVGIALVVVFIVGCISITSWLINLF